MAPGPTTATRRTWGVRGANWAPNVASGVGAGQILGPGFPLLAAGGLVAQFL
jgi:hypothetical protein